MVTSPKTDSGDPSAFYLPRGRILGQDLSTIHPVEHTGVAETVVHSWYEYPDGDATQKHPVGRIDEPEVRRAHAAVRDARGPRQVQLAQGASIRGPAHGGRPPCPHARRLRERAQGRQARRRRRAGAPSGSGPAALFSTLGRIAARAIETQLLAARLPVWLADLEANLKSGDLAVADVTKWDPSSWPADARGWGMEEAPRGALGHWVVIKDQKIENYQLVVPSHLERLAARRSRAVAGRGRKR